VNHQLECFTSHDEIPVTFYSFVDDTHICLLHIAVVVIVVSSNLSQDPPIQHPPVHCRTKVITVIILIHPRGEKMVLLVRIYKLVWMYASWPKNDGRLIADIRVVLAVGTVPTKRSTCPNRATLKWSWNCRLIRRKFRNQESRYIV
jgi:hypothetical protein